MAHDFRLFGQSVNGGLLSALTSAITHTRADNTTTTCESAIRENASNILGIDPNNATYVTTANISKVNDISYVREHPYIFAEFLNPYGCALILTMHLGKGGYNTHFAQVGVLKDGKVISRFYEASAWTNWQGNVTSTYTLNGCEFKRYGDFVSVVMSSDATFQSDGKTLLTLPEAYRPRTQFVIYSKVYNGSGYIDCSLKIESSGQVYMTDIYTSALSGSIQTHYFKDRNFMYPLF